LLLSALVGAAERSAFTEKASGAEAVPARERERAGSYVDISQSWIHFDFCNGGGDAPQSTIPLLMDG
jgi:hypothetical protein